MNQPVELVTHSVSKKYSSSFLSDPYNRRLIWTIIKKLKATGKCVLLTTHFLEEAVFSRIVSQL